MNYKEAFNALEIDYTIKYNDISLDYIKKQYHKLALKYHPDKNGNTETSNIRFREINEAYNYLKRELKKDIIDIENYDDDKEEYNDDSFIYLNMLQSFIKSVVESKYVEIVFSIINALLITGKHLSIQLFEGIDKDTALHIYNFLSKYRTIIHFNNDLISEMREILLSKYNNVEIYRLNPSIHDLMENNVYKLYVNNQLYLVPLWHNEMYYDCSGCEIIVICEPELPDGMKIDEENNLYIERDISARHDLPDMIINNENVSVTVGDKLFSIPLSNLYMKKEQCYRFQKQGISKVNNDIYNIGDKSDIFVKINIC